MSQMTASLADGADDSAPRRGRSWPVVLVLMGAGLWAVATVVSSQARLGAAIEVLLVFGIAWGVMGRLRRPRWWLEPADRGVVLLALGFLALTATSALSIPVHAIATPAFPLRAELTAALAYPLIVWGLHGSSARRAARRSLGLAEARHCFPAAARVA